MEVAKKWHAQKAVTIFTLVLLALWNRKLSEGPGGAHHHRLNGALGTRISWKRKWRRRLPRWPTNGNSQEIDTDDLTYRYSAGSDKFVEKAEEVTGYHSAHSSEENAFSRSSSEQSVIKRMSYTSDDQEHNALNAAPPPYPHSSVSGGGYNSQNIPSPPPYTSPNSTPRVGDGTGQLAPRIDTGVGGEGDGPYPFTSVMLKPNMGIRKVPSPNESIESMTLSEQEALLAKA